MKCPYCAEEMEKGLIESSEPINFMKGIRFVNKADKREGKSLWQNLLLAAVLLLTSGCAEAVKR